MAGTKDERAEIIANQLISPIPSLWRVMGIQSCRIDINGGTAHEDRIDQFKISGSEKFILLTTCAGCLIPECRAHSRERSVRKVHLPHSKDWTVLILVKIWVYLKGNFLDLA